MKISIALKYLDKRVNSNVKKMIISKFKNYLIYHLIYLRKWNSQVKLLVGAQVHEELRSNYQIKLVNKLLINNSSLVIYKRFRKWKNLTSDIKRKMMFTFSFSKV